MPQEHIVSSFDRDLEGIQALIMRMGGLVEESILNAATALETRDEELAQRVRRADKAIDELELQVNDVAFIEKVDKHHEYREKLLPAYVISYKGHENLKAYVSAGDGKLQTVRHRDWRIFDFLWMTHTMDYEGRDDFNTTVLRAISLLGLITVLSGFLLWYISSPSIIKFKKRLKRNQ